MTNALTTRTRATFPTQFAALPTASDDFVRANQSGWGTSTGSSETWVSIGSYTFSIVGNQGKILSNNTSAVQFEVLGSSSLQDVVVWGRVEADTSTNDVAVIARKQSGSTYYMAEMNAGNFEVLKVVAGTVTSLYTITKPYSANTKYWEKLECVGTSPTTLQAKFWADGTAEPGTWDISITDSESTLQTSGKVGVRYKGGNTHFCLWDGFYAAPAAAAGGLNAQFRAKYTTAKSLIGLNRAKYTITKHLIGKAWAKFSAPITGLLKAPARVRFPAQMTGASQEKQTVFIPRVFGGTLVLPVLIEDGPSITAHAKFSSATPLVGRARSKFSTAFPQLFSRARARFINAIPGVHFLVTETQALFSTQLPNLGSVATTRFQTFVRYTEEAREKFYSAMRLRGRFRSKFSGKFAALTTRSRIKFPTKMFGLASVSATRFINKIAGKALAAAAAARFITKSSVTLVTGNPYGVTTARFNQGPDPYMQQRVNDMLTLGMGRMRIQQNWSLIEPSEGSFNWAYLDDAIGRCNAAGIKTCHPLRADQGGPATWFQTVLRNPGQTNRTTCTHGNWVNDFIYGADPTKMAAFATALAHRYNGQTTPNPFKPGTFLFIDFIEIGNEEDDGEFDCNGATGAGYQGQEAREPKWYWPLVLAVAPAIKAASPNTQVGMWGMWWQDITHREEVISSLYTNFDTHGKTVASYLDYFNFHCYIKDPSLDESSASKSLTYLLSDLGSIVKSHGDTKPFRVTEIGWAIQEKTGDPTDPTAATEGQWMSKALDIMRKSGNCAGFDVFTMAYNPTGDDIPKGKSITQEAGATPHFWPAAVSIQSHAQQFPSWSSFFTLFALMHTKFTTKKGLRSGTRTKFKTRTRLRGETASRFVLSTGLKQLVSRILSMFRIGQDDPIVLDTFSGIDGSDIFSGVDAVDALSAVDAVDALSARDGTGTFSGIG